MTWKQILEDPRVENGYPQYDGRGRNMIELKEGYRFSSCNSTIEIGTVKELAYCLKNDVIYKP